MLDTPCAGGPRARKLVIPGILRHQRRVCTMVCSHSTVLYQHRASTRKHVVLRQCSPGTVYGCSPRTRTTPRLDSTRATDHTRLLGSSISPPALAMPAYRGAVGCGTSASVEKAFGNCGGHPRALSLQVRPKMGRAGTDGRGCTGRLDTELWIRAGSAASRPERGRWVAWHAMAMKWTDMRKGPNFR